MSKIKICGLTKTEDILVVNKYLPDYIGFVFAKSKRQVSKEKAKKLKGQLDSRIKAVGVWVNEDPEVILQIVKENIVDMIQLHGDETTRDIEYLKKHMQIPIIKALRIGDPRLTKEKLKEYDNIKDNHLDYLLLDKYSDTSYGGMGECFNWNEIEQMKLPFFLAGGINLENIDEAILQKAYGIDVSSGVETNGIKDESKIRKIIKKTRGEEDE